MNVRNLPAHPVQYKTRQVGDVEVFYREAGPTDAPVILLLHGFPTSSHMFRNLMPLLADRYRLVAPDLPGFGQTKAPPRGEFDYTFDNLAKVIDAFTEMLQLSRYAIYAFDYGAPTGYRLAVAHPERVTAIISQNGNAYGRDIPSAEVHLLDAGHFALETHGAEIAAYIDEFLSRKLSHSRA
ncbi:alpha/beta fold hydrolase [Paraburkholderia sp. BR14320]|uniref:alpha/beta fold hydrolase n=1 Tax=unclassified Paraburkholderia TaxID=2615204 RepID=UPI0034CE95F5